MLQKCWEEESLILHVAMLSSFIWRSKILGCLFNPTVSWCKGLSSKMTLLTEIYPQLTRGRRRKSPAIWPRIPLETHLSELSQMLLNSQPQGLEGCCHDISAAVMLSEITFYSNGSHKANEPEPNYLTHTTPTHTHTHPHTLTHTHTPLDLLFSNCIILFFDNPLSIPLHEVPTPVFPWHNM